MASSDCRLAHLAPCTSNCTDRLLCLCTLPRLFQGKLARNYSHTSPLQVHTRMSLQIHPGTIGMDAQSGHRTIFTFNFQCNITFYIPSHCVVLISIAYYIPRILLYLSSISKLPISSVPLPSSILLLTLNGTARKCKKRARKIIAVMERRENMAALGRRRLYSS